MKEKKVHRVICFGEVLWDILPSGAVPGGAPMNVAYHLFMQQKNPALITRVGNDERGRQLIDIFSGHGVCTDYFQTDSEYETGKVFAKPNEHHEMVYDIVKPSAWDFIEWKDEYAEMVSAADYFVFGSLAARNNASKTTLLQLLQAAKKRVLDINLRAPHFDRRIVEELVGKTDLLKLNLSELELITGWFAEYATIDDRVRSLADRFDISQIVITMGAEGAYLYMNGEIYRHPGFKITVKDTVGSGDAFLAGLLSRLMENDKPQDALTYANGLGAFVATQTGACPVYKIGDVMQMINSSSVQQSR
jgi:fructokinase